MTRLTFQFIPSKPATSSDVSLDYATGQAKQTEELLGGLTAIHFNDGTRLGYDTSGHLRYSVNVNNISNETLYTVYESALEIIEDTLSREGLSYTVCLILNGKNIVSIYLDQIDSIKNFASREFNSSHLDYTELNGQTIKISFNRDSSEIAF